MVEQDTAVVGKPAVVQYNVVEQDTAVVREPAVVQHTVVEQDIASEQNTVAESGSAAAEQPDKRAVADHIAEGLVAEDVWKKGYLQFVDSVMAAECKCVPASVA